MTARLALSAAAIAVFALFASGEESAPTRVSIKSQPEGATVIVDGRDRGTTPTILFDLAPGRHHVKFRLAGYEERDRFFDAAPGVLVEKHEVLVEEKGLLLLRSEPEGCNIAVDGVSVGKTPRLITNLAAKDTYSVRLTKAGYQPLTISVKFNGREPLVRTESLVLDSGVVNILSDPSGAEVSVNDVVRGKTPILVRGVPKGRAMVKFKLPGFKDEVREIAMKAGDQQTLSIAMTALPGTLNLMSVPEGASFYVNDKAYGRGPVAIPSLAPGEYNVRAEMAGYGTMTRTVTIGNGESAREEFKMSNVMGKLELRTSPPDVQVVVDGRVVGTTKSSDPNAEFSDDFLVENLLEGEHRLVLKRDGYAELVRHPSIQSSKTVKHSFRLRRVFVPDVEIVTARGSYQGVLVNVTPEYVVVEVSLGITRSFPRSEIRKMNTLGEKK